MSELPKPRISPERRKLLNEANRPIDIDRQLGLRSDSVKLIRDGEEVRKVRVIEVEFAL